MSKSNPNASKEKLDADRAWLRSEIEAGVDPAKAYEGYQELRSTRRTRDGILNVDRVRGLRATDAFFAQEFAKAVTYYNAQGGFHGGMSFAVDLRSLANALGVRCDDEDIRTILKEETGEHGKRPAVGSAGFVRP